MENKLQIIATTAESTTILAVGGSVDSFTADQLTAAFGGVLSSGCTRLIADLGGVDYTSSAGLRSLLITAKDARKLGGDLRLAAVRPHVQRVLSLSGFTSIFQIYDDVPTALASCAARA